MVNSVVGHVAVLYSDMILGGVKYFIFYSLIFHELLTPQEICKLTTYKCLPNQENESILGATTRGLIVKH